MCDEASYWDSFDPPESWYESEVVDVNVGYEYNDNDYDALNEKLQDVGMRLGILGGVKTGTSNIVKVDGCAASAEDLNAALDIAKDYFGGISLEEYHEGLVEEQSSPTFFERLGDFLFG